MLGEGLDLEIVISSFSGNCSSIFGLTFLKESSFREPAQHVKKKIS